MENFSYIIGDDKTHLGVIIDPGFDTEKILNKASQMKLTIKYLINTHEHPDHISGNMDLSEKTGAKIVAHKDAKIKKDLAVKDEAIIRVGETNIKVLHTPGHSPGSICLLVDNKLITGDTLFVGECGRIDLPGGNAEDLYHSFFDKILKISDNVEIYPGHDYGHNETSLLGHEKKINKCLIE